MKLKLKNLPYSKITKLFFLPTLEARGFVGFMRPFKWDNMDVGFIIQSQKKIKIACMCSTIRPCFAPLLVNNVSNIYKSLKIDERLM
jgi:hypothetical protein